MADRRKRDRGKEQFWRRMVRLWRRTGLSVRDFCSEHGITEPSFYAWRRIVTARDQEVARVRAKAERDSAHRVAPGSDDDAPTFVPLRVIDTSTQATLEVVLERGRVVRVLRGFDAATLRQLLTILEEERPC